MRGSEVYSLYSLLTTITIMTFQSDSILKNFWKNSFQNKDSSHAGNTCKVCHLQVIYRGHLQKVVFIYKRRFTEIYKTFFIYIVEKVIYKTIIYSDLQKNFFELPEISCIQLPPMHLELRSIS